MKNYLKIVYLVVIIISITSCNKERKGEMRFKEASPYDSTINAMGSYDEYEVSHSKSQETLENIHINTLNEDTEHHRHPQSESYKDIRNMSIEEIKRYSKHHHFTQEELHYLRYNYPNYIFRTSGIEYQIDKQEYEDRTNE